MRLDHLLSKEHLKHDRPIRAVVLPEPDLEQPAHLESVMSSAGQLKGGTLTLVVMRRRALSTALGPGTDHIEAGRHARCWVLRDRHPASAGTGSQDSSCPASAGATERRPYFENYTVDASILDSGREPRITDVQHESAAHHWSTPFTAR